MDGSNARLLSPFSSVSVQTEGLGQLSSPNGLLAPTILVLFLWLFCQRRNSILLSLFVIAHHKECAVFVNL